MKFAEVIRRRLKGGGTVHAAVAANVNEAGGSTYVSSHQRIVQRSGDEPVSHDKDVPDPITTHSTEDANDTKSA